MTALNHIVDAKRYEITPAQFAVDSEVEQREFPGSPSQLQSNPNGPDFFQFQWRLLAEQLALVPRQYTPFDVGSMHERLLC
jgi:hypothetical protein